MSFNTLDTLRKLSELIRIQDVILKSIDGFPVKEEIYDAIKRVKN